MTGACVSMSLMKALVILSSSSTSLMFRGTPPPGIETGPGGEGFTHTHIYIHYLHVFILACLKGTLLFTIEQVGFEDTVSVCPEMHHSYRLTIH